MISVVWMPRRGSLSDLLIFVTNCHKITIITIVHYAATIDRLAYKYRY